MLTRVKWGMVKMIGRKIFSRYLLPVTWYTAACGHPMRAVSSVAVPELTIAALACATIL